VQVAAPLPLIGFPLVPPHVLIAVPPSKNSMLPVGVPEPGPFAVTVAVRVKV
jgi:hypothetical protein